MRESLMGTSLFYSKSPRKDSNPSYYFLAKVLKYSLPLITEIKSSVKMSGLLSIWNFFAFFKLILLTLIYSSLGRGKGSGLCLEYGSDTSATSIQFVKLYLLFFNLSFGLLFSMGLRASDELGEIETESIKLILKSGVKQVLVLELTTI